MKKFPQHASGHRSMRTMLRHEKAKIRPLKRPVGKVCRLTVWCCLTVKPEVSPRMLRQSGSGAAEFRRKGQDMKVSRNFIFLVDQSRPAYAPPRSTRGRYRVGARNRKEAEEYLHEAIKIGAVTFCCEDMENRNAMRGQVIRECGGERQYQTVR